MINNMYLKPERICGETHSFDSDIWALAVTVAECALGKFPFDLQEGTIWEVINIYSLTNDFS